MTHMTASEAMVETLRVEGVNRSSASSARPSWMRSTSFPPPGIRFIPVRHEQSAGHMADGYARVTGAPSVCTGQNGPGITNMVTAIAAAYHAHSPVVHRHAVGDDQRPRPRRLPGGRPAPDLPHDHEVSRCRCRAPTAWPRRSAPPSASRSPSTAPCRSTCRATTSTKRSTATILEPEQYRVAARGAGDEAALDRAAEVLAGAANPAIIAGAGVVDSGGADEVRRLARLLSAPVATTYLHTDAYPSSDELAVGPIGYQGSKAAMGLLSKADVILAVGTRLSGFGTLPQYGFDYFPKGATIIQIDIDPRQLGSVPRRSSVGIIGDAKAAAGAIADRLRARLGDAAPDEARLAAIAAAKRAWADELDAWSSSDASRSARAAPSRSSPRRCRPTPS